MLCAGVWEGGDSVLTSFQQVKRLVFNSCPCLSPGEPSLKKRSPEGALQDQRVVRIALTESEGTVEALGVSSSAPVVSGGAVAVERSPPICEGELCGVSSSSMSLGWNRPCLFAALGVL